MSSLQEYYEQQLAALRRQGEQDLRQARAQLRAQMEIFLNEEIAKHREIIRKSNGDAIARFDQGSAALEEKKKAGKSHPRLLEAEGKFLQVTLESTLEGNKKILDAVIDKLPRELQRYRALD